MRSKESQQLPARHRSPGDIVIELRGECDASSLEQLNATFANVLTERPARVVVDITQVTFIDSMTLGSLTAAAKRVRATGGTFEVVGALEVEVQRAFQLTGLDSYLLGPPA